MPSLSQIAGSPKIKKSAHKLGKKVAHEAAIICAEHTSNLERALITLNAMSAMMTISVALLHRHYGGQFEYDQIYGMVRKYQDGLRPQIETAIDQAKGSDDVAFKADKRLKAAKALLRAIRQDDEDDE